ncbi:MAG: precorrin-2 C(20)-methyltransferase [Bacteroidota bacterium]|jgi:precorrin-2/cobalt-factor-2 C20-methyltransferase|nr:precorrin-2 C(20)-methyltransferase [Bacteroidota bacterium]
MNTGCFYGIGIGPGDPELVTVKAARILSECNNVFVPRPETNQESMAFEIARQYIRPDAQIHQLIFPMTTDPDTISRQWSDAARQVLAVLTQGKDVCFLTLGDALLYSTYIYLLRELKSLSPSLKIITIPGITSFSAAAALTGFSLGEGKERLSIVPAADDLESVRRALSSGGTVVLMKIGKRLADILDILEAAGLIEDAVFVARAGQAGQWIETDLKKLKTSNAKAGYMSVILVHCGKRCAR